MATNPNVEAVSTRLAQTSTASKVLLAASLVFVINSFLAWQRACFGDICGSASAWHGVGIIAALCAIAALGIEVARMFGARLPVDDLTEARIVAGLAGAVLLFTLIKIFVDDEFRAYGSWIGLIVAVVLVVGGVMRLADANRAALRARREDHRSPTIET